MQTLNIKTNVSIVQEATIKLPLFYKSESGVKWLGVFDENTAIRLYISGEYVSLTRDKANDNWMGQKILEAMSEDKPCSDEEFLNKYDEVLQSLSKHETFAL